MAIDDSKVNEPYTLCDPEISISEARKELSYDSIKFLIYG